MSTDSDYGSHGDRTDAHIANELSAAEAGFAYPEETRTIHFSFDGIDFEIRDAIRSWSASDDGGLYCARCRQALTLVAPNMLHREIMALCRCRSCFMIPLDPRDAALIEMAHPTTEQDAKLAEKFHRELSRLTNQQTHKKETAASRSTKTADSVYQNESNSRTKR
jgi:hypothetical protein